METQIQLLAKEFNQSETHVQNVVDLIDEGYTIPFIARYRKEMHGTMDDTTLRDLADRLSYLRNLAERREEIKKSIAAQDKLTDELSKQIDEAKTLAVLEDLYRPYKQKRRTRATIAKEKGLEPLATQIFAQGKELPALDALAQSFIDPEKGVNSVEEALAGASDIIAETISDDAAIRQKLRDVIAKNAKVGSVAAKEEDSVYRLYYQFDQPMSRLQSHQILAINRGEKEGFLKVNLDLDRALALENVKRAVVKTSTPAGKFVENAAEDAYDRLIFPSVERETRTALTDLANEGAIHNFAINLKPLLMQPPVKGHVTMGLDPGYRNGCKVAVVSDTGKVLDTTVVYPTFGERQKEEAIEKLEALVKKHAIEHIAIGNGTASRETEQMTVELISRSELHDRQRGGRVGLFRKQARRGGVSAVRRQPALRGLDCKTIAGPARGVGQDRPQGHRRGAISARHAAKAPERNARGRGGGLRQRGRRGCQHRIALAAQAGCGPKRNARKKHRGLSRNKRRVYGTKAAYEGAQDGAKGV